MGVKLPEVGKRVRLKSLDIKGKVVFIDSPNIFNHYTQPVQIELDKPYDEHGQTIYRTSIKDLVLLKKKKPVEESKPKVKKKRKPKEELFDWSF